MTPEFSANATVWEVTAAAGKRRFNIRNADALGRPLADPTNLLITVFS